MKMQRGELAAFQGCLSYDYHPEDKSITVNEEEAETVCYIFQGYLEGTGYLKTAFSFSKVEYGWQA